MAQYKINISLEDGERVLGVAHDDGSIGLINRAGLGVEWSLRIPYAATIATAREILAAIRKAHARRALNLGELPCTTDTTPALDDLEASLSSAEPDGSAGSPSES